MKPKYQAVIPVRLPETTRLTPPQLEFTDYSSDGDLRLDEYQATGGMSNVIRTEIESILSPDPEVQKAQLDTLHASFIPWLITINPKNNHYSTGSAHGLSV
jgi:hypothetical protein